MREILFKAKRIIDGEWVEGDIIHSLYKIGDVCVGNFGNGNGIYQVDEKTICQYTGLTDKNGNKIWENDVCDRNEKYPEVVKQHKGDWVLDYSYAFGKEDGYSYCNLGFYTCERNNCVEDIGNIFDDPELLKGGE